MQNEEQRKMGTKVRLRAVEPEDVDFMMECEADREAALWSDYRAPLSRNQLLTYALTYEADPIATGQLRLIIESKAERQKVGIIDIYDISERDSRAFIGICIHPKFRRKHLGTEALDALKQYNEEKLGMRQLLAKISTMNRAAYSLFSTSEYLEIALLPEWHKIGNQHFDFYLMSQRVINKQDSINPESD